MSVFSRSFAEAKRVCLITSLMRPNIAVWFNGVEQTLAGVRVAMVYISVPPKPWITFCLINQIAKIMIVKNFHRMN